MQHQRDNNHHEMWQIAAKDVALAGLFQPYSVGKFNASTALGYHKDQQDVSVRMGYHFTHQLMAKADAAFNDNSLECNVGINDEFNGVRPPACPETRAGIGHQRSRQ
ncbi:YadA C-terminal domain-containing protein [Edwardsiella ictaluri]